jgi:hypothetical protein
MSAITWVFGAAGQYTASWDGVELVTITATSGGAFLASFSAQTYALAQTAVAAYLAQVPVSSPSMSLLATTATSYPSGYALVNGTGTILSWTAPSDGQMHRVIVFGNYDVTSALTGGAVSTHYTQPGGVTASATVMGGGESTGTSQGTTWGLPVAPGTTVNLVQATAVTVGAATIWAEIWGS